MSETHNHNSSSPPSTILAQLIQLIKEISSFPECKSTSKRMYSNLTRRVKLLSPLFEELRDKEDQVSAELVGAFETLVEVLGKAKELLGWVQETSKLFQAIQRDKISSDFLRITGQIEEALSKIPYDKLDLSEEVREQTELVHTQILRAKSRMESPDLQLELDMSIALDESDTDPAVLKRLSESLHLRTMDELRQESRAFHEMVVTSSSDMSEYFGMMSTLFRKLNDYLLTVNPDVEVFDVDKSMIKHRSPVPVIPDDFRCPISLELMKDPVIVSTGQTYERSCIQKWLDAGHKTCPKTQQTLSNTSLTPNYVLKSLITLWCESNGVELPRASGACGDRKTGTSTSNCDQAAIVALLRKLVLGTTEEKRAAAGELRLLAKRNVDNRICIADAGAIPSLVELLSSRDPRTQEHAVTALLNLSIHEANKGIIVNSGAIPHMVRVLKGGSMEARENAAAALFSLSTVDENKVAIGVAGAIPALVDLLVEGTPRGKKDAATAVFNLSFYQGNRVRAVRAGIVGPLVRLLREAEGGGMVDEALAILAILAGHPEGKAAIGQAEPIEMLVELIRTGSPRNRENAAAVLWALCMGDGTQMKAAKELHAEQVLKELAENGTDRAKRKAVSLLESLQTVDETGGVMDGIKNLTVSPT